MDIVEHLLSRVKVTGNGCFEWTRSRDSDGYALGSLPGVRLTRRINRVSYEVFRGPVPTGMFVCHSCDNPPCINPAHLFLGTPKDNTEDAVEKDRIGFGSRMGQAVLSECDIPVIFDMRNSGATAVYIARQYRVAPSTIRKILRRESWRRVSADIA